MKKTPVIVVTAEELRTRMQAILSLLHLDTYQDFLDKKHNSRSGLEGDEWDYDDELSGIAFLLGEDRRPRE